MIPAVLLFVGLLNVTAKPENPLLPVIHNNQGPIIKAEGNVAEASNQFGFNLFQKLTTAFASDTNICISPFSISQALTMTYNGAAGKTREGMAKTLEIEGLSSDFINSAYRQLAGDLSTSDASLTMEIANSIWYQSGTAIKKPFLESARAGFDATIKELSFADPHAVDIINGWVSDKTHNRIKKIIEPPIGADVLMMLINAIYFRAAWTKPFDVSLTSSAPFNLPDGSQTECQMMNRLDDYQYYEDEQLQAVDLPYGNGKFSMTIVLPRPGSDIDEMAAQMNEEKLAGWIKGMSANELRLLLPRFKFSGDFGLNEALKSMGMLAAFKGQKADFSNMSDDRIWLDSVIHKTFIQVDEKGTEASAATAVIMKKGLMPSMVVNHPFLFAIRHRESKTILFLGKVVNPLWESD